MKKLNLKSIVIIFLQISIVVASTNVCKYMMENKITKNKCKLKKINVYEKVKKMECQCSDMSVEFTLANSSLQKILKSNDSFHFQIFFKNQKPAILDKKLKIFDKSLFIFNIRTFFRFHFLKGFDVNSFNFSLIAQKITFAFYESFLNFYTNGQILKTCEHFPSQPRSLFQTFKSNVNILSIIFSNSYYKQICPLAFFNSHIEILYVTHVIDSFYKTNIPSFTDLPKDITDINSNINGLNLYGYGGIVLSPRIINLHVFNHTKKFVFFFEILSIEKETFKNFKYIKDIHIFQHYWHKLFHKGIEWTYNLNSHIKVNLNDSALIEKYLENKSYLAINSELNLRKFIPSISKNIIKETYPDEDFCIYAKFPFDQLIVVFFTYIDIYKYKNTCTFTWLIQYIFYYPIIKNY